VNDPGETLAEKVARIEEEHRAAGHERATPHAKNERATPLLEPTLE
jgi:hypothetical protein